LISEIDLKDYFTTFVQPARYAIKTSAGWRSNNKAIPDPVIQAHLDKKYSVGVLGRWYPEGAAFDFDEVPRDRVDEVRAQLSLNDSNSMLCSSESLDSYHLWFRPTYNGNPPTIRKMQDILEPFAKSRGIEIYPQKNRVFRLPFGKFQECLDPKYSNLPTWAQKTYWFQKLDDFDISTVCHQLPLGLKYKPAKLEPGRTFETGRFLLQNGLQTKSDRNHSQFAVIYYLWRCGVPRDETVKQVVNWINARHNNLSKDIFKYSKHVTQEIQAQVHRVYSDYDNSRIYPDATHNHFNGFIAKPDIETIIEISKGSWPRMNFLFHLVKYAYPRRHRPLLTVHSGNLVSWSSNRTYQNYLNELEQKGIVTRGKAYLVGQYSKSLMLNWRYKSEADAVLYDGRSIDTLDGTIKLLMKPQDFNDLLRKSGTEKRWRNTLVKRVYAEQVGTNA
jgi:hypothetical protein